MCFLSFWACGGGTTAKPEAPARSAPRHPLVGIWEDPNSSIRHEIRAKGDGVEVVAAIDKDDGEACVLQSQQATAETLQWTLLVPSSGVVLEMRLVRVETPAGLLVAWKNSRGSAGETVLKRIK
jgi:hypothetical protein